MSLESLETTEAEAEALPCTGTQTPAPAAHTPPPATIGQHLPHLQGHYAGIASDLEGGEPGHLVLLDAQPTKDLDWDDANKWAESLGDHARLPTKAEAALLFANLKDKLTPTWHWTGTQYSASYAWYCDFYVGDVYDSRKSYEGSAVAVRRLPLQYFSTLPGVAA